MGAQRVSALLVLTAFLATACGERQTEAPTGPDLAQGGGGCNFTSTTGVVTLTKNEFGATPMSEAAVIGNPAMLGLLLEAGADVESANADGQTALMVVARTGRVEAARLLIARGANVNAKETWRGQTALMWASAQRQPAIVTELIARGADVNARSTVNNWQRQVTAEPRSDDQDCRHGEECQSRL